MDKEAVRRFVQVAVDNSGMSRARFAEEAEIDAGTLGDFLNGSRWAHKHTFRKIEKVLGWSRGRIDDLLQSGDPMPDATFLDALEQDPNLPPEVKEAFRALYQQLVPPTLVDARVVAGNVRRPGSGGPRPLPKPRHRP